MEELQNMLLVNHAYVPLYQQAWQTLQNKSRQDVTARLCFNSTQDQHRYNLPTADKVAILLSGDGSQNVGYLSVLVLYQTEASSLT